MSGLVKVTAPTLRPIGLQEFKDFAKVDLSYDDATLEAMLDAAIAHLDGDKGVLGRAILSQTWDYYLDEMPCEKFKVPLPPLQSVTFFKYTDLNGTVQTLAADQYRVSTNSQPGTIEPAYDVTWPDARCVSDSIQVRFVAGWTTPALIPADLRLAIMQFAAWWYEQKLPAVLGTIVSALPFHLETVLYKHRIDYYV